MTVVSALINFEFWEYRTTSVSPFSAGGPKGAEAPPLSFPPSLSGIDFTGVYIPPQGKSDHRGRAKEKAEEENGWEIISHLGLANGMDFALTGGQRFIADELGESLELTEKRPMVSRIMSKTAKALLLSGVLSFILPSPLWAGCPEGTLALEDVATGKVICKREDILRTEPTGTLPAPGTPPEPLSPPSPPEPQEPGEAERVPPQVLSPSDCRISLIGCQEECRRTYLVQAQDAGAGAAARAGERLEACLNVCEMEFPCPKAP